MISRHLAGTGGATPDHLIVFRLTVVLAAYALLAFAGKRRWLRPNEILWVGLAEIFWALAWLLQPTILVVRTHILGRDKAALVSLGMVLPVLIAMAVGLRFIMKAAGQAVDTAAPVRVKAK